MLRHKPDHACEPLHGVLMRRLTIEQKLAVKGMQESRNTPQKRGFTASVGADNGGDLALREF